MTTAVATVNHEAHLLGNDRHNLPRSKVVHCRSVPDGCRESDLLQAMKVFGNVEALRLIPKKNQGLVEFQTMESAIACVTYSTITPVRVFGCNIGVNYSKSTEIMRHFNESSHPEQQPTHVLLMTIINVIHPVDVEVIKKICEKRKVEVQRIVFFHKNGLQALVEFENVEDATNIQNNLNGCDIYPGCCTLKIEYSNAEKLNVRQNTSELYNIDLINENAYDTATKKLMKKMAALLGDSENLAAVQDIILKVLAGGTMNNNSYSCIPPGAKGLLPTAGLNRMPLLKGTDETATQNKGGQHSNYLQKAGQHANFPLGLSNAVPYGVGGIGCVAMVYGINNDVVNCHHLFNLFCLYGNVVKVKILPNKPGCGMVQYVSKVSTELAIQHLNEVTLFGQQLHVSFSKHPYIAESAQCSTLFDQSPSVVSFYDSLNNRFKFIQGGRNSMYQMIHPPSKVLHYFNAPPDYSQEQLQQLFKLHNAEAPLKHVTIPKPNSRSALGLLEFSSVEKAIEAAMLVNHVTLRKNDGNMESALSAEKGAPFTLKLAFSSSESIN